MRSNELHKSEISNKHDIQNGVFEINLKNMFLTHFRFRAYKTLIRRTYSRLNFWTSISLGFVTQSQLYWQHTFYDSMAYIYIQIGLAVMNKILRKNLVILILLKQ